MNKAVVLGSINQDIIAVTRRHPGPGETVSGQRLMHLPGGKGANEAVAIACAGSESILIGAVGDDDAGHRQLAFLKSCGVNTGFVRTFRDTSTGTAIITVDSSGENTVVVIPGANERVEDNEEVGLEAGDVLLAQFEVPATAIQSFFERGRRNGCRTILNPSPVAKISADLMALVDMLVINETELAALVGKFVEQSDRAAICSAASELRTSNTVVVTLGGAGAIAVGDGGSIDVRGIQADAIDTTGAGDCFVGSLAAELARGESFEAAIQYANRAAAVCVTREGAGPSMPTRDDMLLASD